MKTKKAIPFLLVLFAVVLIQCKSSQNSADSNQETFDAQKDLRENWTLEWMEGVAVNDSNFTENRYPYFELYPLQDSCVGHTSCNSYFGTIAVDSNKISFSNMILTRKACAGVKESEYVALVNRVNNYKREGKKLLLFDGETQILRYRKSY